MRLPAPCPTLETERSTPFAPALTAGHRRALAVATAWALAHGIPPDPAAPTAAPRSNDQNQWMALGGVT